MSIALTMVLVILAGATLLTPDGRRAMQQRTWQEWSLDLGNLVVQGVIVPALAAVAGPMLWSGWFYAQSWDVGFWGGLAIQLFAVDWLYYWNHRLLHRLWPIHRVHHSASAMDVWVSSRNTLWSSAFIIYFWANTLFLHTLRDPSGYLVGVALTAALDLWRHSPLQLAVPGLIQPRHHAWHHGPEGDVNFGANWTLWDRLHGTFYDPGFPPHRLGVPAPRSWLQAAFWPFGATP